MNFRRIVAALVLCLDLTPTWAIEARGVPPQVSTPHSELVGDCTEVSVQPRPLPPRPALRRSTHASRPRRHRRRHAIAHKRPVLQRHHLRHRARRPRHLAPHRPHSAGKQVSLHRLSYPSPLCAKRSHLINALIGLPDNEYAATQPPIPPEETAEVGNITTLPPFWPTPGAGIVDYPPVIFPYTPIYPPGPGPILLPPVPPVGPNPPVTPPVVTIPRAPEPAAWAMMSIGFALIGGSLRARVRRYSGSQARSSPA